VSTPNADKHIGSPSARINVQYPEQPHEIHPIGPKPGVIWPYVRAAKVAKEGSFYTPVAGSRESGFKARPVFYGMMLAGQLAGGRMRAMTLDAPQAGATAYAADMENSGTRIVVINKDASSDLLVRIQSRSGVRIWRLEAPGLTATAEVTLAGAPRSIARSPELYASPQIVSC
jgi:hypothetical protein